MLEPSEKNLLEQTAKLTEENNRILKNMQRSARFGRIVRVLYWVILIAVALGAYYFIEPYLETLLKFYGNLQGMDIDKLFLNVGR